MSARVVRTVLVSLALLAAPSLCLAAPHRAGAAAAKEGRAVARGEKAGKRDEKRDQKRAATLRRAGVDEARIQRVLDVMKKYDAERAPVQEAQRAEKKKLHDLVQSSSTDESAYRASLDAVRAGEAKLQGIRDRQRSEVAGILKPSEQAKLMGKAARAAREGKQRRARAK